MIRSLLQLFTPEPEESEESRQRRLRLAAAALLVETSRADFEQEEVEEKALATALRQGLQLDDGEVESLLAEANTHADHATSLYQFTRVINDHFTAEQKAQLVEMMWQVAWADGNLHHYEEHLIRKVADLIYVPHELFIRGKLDTRPRD